MTSKQFELSNPLIFLMALAIGVIVADLYYLQPLLHQVSKDFAISSSKASLLMTLVQVGYALGLAFVVPLGDIIPRRRLLVGIYLLAAILMGAAASIHSFNAFAIMSLFIGLTSVGGQVIVPFAADFAKESERSRVIAKVMTGLLLGILFSRTFSGIMAQALGWRGVYWIAAGLLVTIAAILRLVLPEEFPREHMQYHELLYDAFSFILTHHHLRRRAYFGFLMFATFSAVWTVLSFHLAIGPFYYSNATIGLFGLFGVAGVLAANLTGTQADKDRLNLTTRVAGSLMLLSFAMFWFGRSEYLFLGVALILLDAGMQGMQISNQAIIYSLAPQKRSRINSIYMVSCFLGASTGSFLVGHLYQRYGWAGACILGAILTTAIMIPSFFWSAPKKVLAESGEPLV
ncbi:MAG: MFS transporter [Actinomycetota bacterium]